MIDRRQFLQSAGVSGMAAAQVQAQAGHELPPPERKAKKNVIWMFADQLRSQSLSYNGDPNARTPNLARAHTNGLTFGGNLSGFPLCCPFRGSLLTSRYPHQCVPGHEYPLPLGQKTIADVMNSNGYKTAWFGKWHLGGWHEKDGRAAFFITDPARRGGFQTFAGYENNNSQWDCWVHGGQDKDAFHYRLPGYETDELTNLLIRYIKERAADQNPFFAVMSCQPPHDPYVAPERFMTNYNPEKLEMRANVAHSKTIMADAREELAGYYAMIENFDWNYGRVMQALEESGLLFDTQIMFFSDHGDMHGSQGMFRKTCPYEESIRVPFTISAGVPRNGGLGTRPVISNHVDIAPTTLGLCGIKKPDWMLGHDLSHFRTQTEGDAGPDSAYLQSVIPTGHPHSINTPYRGVVTKDGWKYCCFENRSWLQFNLNDDPYEEANLAQNNKYRAERKKLTERLRQWVADTGDKFVVPAD